MPTTQLPGRNEEEKQRRSFIQRLHANLLHQLKEDRRLFAQNRFGDLDRALGRKGGFLRLVVNGRERLSLARLLATLDYLGIHVVEFFFKIFPLRRVPPPAIGYLVRCKEAVRTQTRIPFRQELLEWGRTVSISSEGTSFNQDTDALLDILQVNSAAAYRLSLAALEGIVSIKPERLTPQAAENLCRVLIPLADLMRVRGDRNTACDLLDLAFGIESKLECMALRAFIYRMAAYLLSDLARLSESELFADRAVRLSLLSGEVSGLGRSLYVRGLMIWRQAHCDDARPYFQAALGYLQDEQSGVRTAILFSLANCELETGSLEETQQRLNDIEKLMPVRQGASFAKLLLSQAEVRSLQGDQQAADRLFSQAISEFASEESADDVAYGSLKYVEHLLRWGQAEQALEVAQKLLGIAERVQHEGGGAILLETVRLAVRGQLSATFVQQSLNRWQRPWLFRKK